LLPGPAVVKRQAFFYSLSFDFIAFDFPSLPFISLHRTSFPKGLHVWFFKTHKEKQ